MLGMTARKTRIVGHILGSVFLLGGIIGLLWYFAGFDVTVPVPTSEFFGHTIGGGRVVNLGLMNERTNGMLFSTAVAIFGGALFRLSNKRRRPAKAARA